MGVMPCSRECCHSIMCDTYVDGIGYICNECQDEFKQFLLTSNFSPKKENEIETVLGIFIRTDKDTYNKSKEACVDTFFKDRTYN